MWNVTFMAGHMTGSGKQRQGDDERLVVVGYIIACNQIHSKIAGEVMTRYILQNIACNYMPFCF